MQSSTIGELLAYDSTGAQVKVLGIPGGGSGAGEFMSIDAVAVDAQDTLYIVDNQLRRVSIFTPSLDYVRHFSLPWPVEDFALRRLPINTRPWNGAKPRTASSATALSSVKTEATRLPLPRLASAIASSRSS